MGFDIRQQFTYHPGEDKKPSQPTPATNPWTTPQPSTPSNQQSNAWNPWTNPPAPAPPSNTSHHYVYHPVSSSAAETRQQPAAPNPWTNPPAPTPSISISSNWSHQAVYNPYFPNTTSPAPMYYPGGSQSAHIQFYTSQPAAEPNNFVHYQGLTAKQVSDRAQNYGGFNQVQLVPRDASPDNEFLCRELDGSWSTRTIYTIMNSLQPGKWEGSGNHLYWARHSQE